MVVGLIFKDRKPQEVVLTNNDHLGKQVVLSLSQEELYTLHQFGRTDYARLEQSLLDAIEESQGLRPSSLEDILILVDDGTQAEINAKYSKLENVIIIGKPRLL